MTMDAAALLLMEKRIVLFWLNWSLKNRTYSAHMRHFISKTVSRHE